MLGKMRYRLALDLGAKSLGWALIRLNAENKACAIIKAGARIFSDGRIPAGGANGGASLAVTRRMARAMRRRRDRLLKRKARMTRLLIEHGFFPDDEAQRKALVSLDPYLLRAKGLDEALTPAEFGRALFHINQRRGFKSNRKTDRGASDTGAMKKAISQLQKKLAPYPIGEDGKPLKPEQFDFLSWIKRESLETKNDLPRTVGELLNRRLQNTTAPASERTTRARSNQLKGAKLVYDLYIDRAMIEAEFDALWAKQAELNPALFNEKARNDLRDTLINQRKLKPAIPGRCSLIPENERAPLALPSTQRFRIYQEVNNLRLLNSDLKDRPLDLDQRNLIVAALERSNQVSFIEFKSLLRIGGSVEFNIEDFKRRGLKGNATSAKLAKADHFGAAWHHFDLAKQDAIVLELLNEVSESKLVAWLQAETGIDEQRAERIANAGLPEGYGRHSAQALARILPELRKAVVDVRTATIAAGFLPPGPSDEILAELPYYGEALKRHVGFGSENPADPPEKRFGRIANPTVHIGLNQVRKVVNALIARYGHPREVIIELARELKQSKERRDEEAKRQAKNQERNDKFRKDIAAILEISEERVKRDDIEKMILWQELNRDPANRRCPYSGVQISERMLLSDEVEIEHILPRCRTLDDSLNNKTVAMRHANRIKGNLTPWDAFGKKPIPGFDYAAILERTKGMAKAKAYRFAEDGYQKWLKEDADFLPRALNDTRHMSRVAKEYLSLICPETRAIPGQMTAQLRRTFGLNTILSTDGGKNRNDHRHHAVDACVIGITDEPMLQHFAQASADAREKQLNKLVEGIRPPWPTFRQHVERAIDNIYVSHKPDHNFEGPLFDATAYGIRRDGSIVQKRGVEGKKERVIDYVVPIAELGQGNRHGVDESGSPLPYKGYQPAGNYCMEVIGNETGQWEMEVIPTYVAYKYATGMGWPATISSAEVMAAISNNKLSNKPGQLVMKLVKDDVIRVAYKGQVRLLQVVKMSVDGGVTFCQLNEANVSARYTAKLNAKKKLKSTNDLSSLNKEEQRALEDVFILSQIGVEDLQKGKARKVTISPIGELRDPGFRE